MMSTPDGIAARGAQARNNLVVALRECCDLADGVETLEGPELLEVLVYLDSSAVCDGRVRSVAARGREGFWRRRAVLISRDMSCINWVHGA